MGIPLCNIDKINCFNQYFSSNGADQQVTFNISYNSGGTSGTKVPNILSYININISSSTPYLFPTTAYNGWCIDVNNSVNVGPTYTYGAYSILDPNILSTSSTTNPFLAKFKQCNPNITIYANNFPAILYILNTAQGYENINGFNSSDIQTAIWTLLYNSPIVTPYIGTLTTDSTASNYNDASVRYIINNAINIQNSYPDYRYIPLLFPKPIMGLVTLSQSGNCTQFLLVQIQLDQITLCCCPGATGPTGANGIAGATGPTGMTGNAGQNAAQDSSFFWSATQQAITSPTAFQMINFEQPPILPPGSSFNFVNDSENTFYSTQSGYYLITYKIDVRSGFVNGTTTAAALLTVADPSTPTAYMEVAGSASLIQAPETNHIYSISNTILYNYTTGSLLSLWVWSNNGQAGANAPTVGQPSLLTGIVPNIASIREAVASLVITRIVQT